MKIEALKGEIKNISEPRRTGYGNIRHKLEDIIIIGLCTVICGGEDFADMEAFGKINPAELSSCLINWVSAERKKRSAVAIDGKTICGSGNDRHKAYHVVSAFAAENQITLGELNVEEKTNEITAVPEFTP